LNDFINRHTKPPGSKLSDEIKDDFYSEFGILKKEIAMANSKLLSCEVYRKHAKPQST